MEGPSENVTKDQKSMFMKVFIKTVSGGLISGSGFEHVRQVLSSTF